MKDKVPFYANPPEPELEERMDLEAHLLKVHGMTLQKDLSLLRLKAAHEWKRIQDGRC